MTLGRQAGGTRRGLETLLLTGLKPGKIRFMSFNYVSSLFFLFPCSVLPFKNLISCVDDSALNPTDGANGGGEDDEDDGEGEEGEEQQLHGEGETGEEWGGLRLRIFHQI